MVDDSSGETTGVLVDTRCRSYVCLGGLCTWAHVCHSPAVGHLVLLCFALPIRALTDRESYDRTIWPYVPFGPLYQVFVLGKLQGSCATGPVMLNDSYPHQILTQCGCLSVSKQVLGPVSVWCCIPDSHAVCLCVWYACTQAHGACVFAPPAVFCGVCMCMFACMGGRCTYHLCAGCLPSSRVLQVPSSCCVPQGVPFAFCVCAWKGVVLDESGSASAWHSSVGLYVCAHGTIELQATVTSAVLGNMWNGGGGGDAEGTVVQGRSVQQVHAGAAAMSVKNSSSAQHQQAANVQQVIQPASTAEPAGWCTPRAA
jgi:hypothetical protein